MYESIMKNTYNAIKQLYYTYKRLGQGYPVANKVFNDIHLCSHGFEFILRCHVEFSEAPVFFNIFTFLNSP